MTSRDPQNENATISIPLFGGVVYSLAASFLIAYLIGTWAAITHVGSTIGLLAIIVAGALFWLGGHPRAKIELADLRDAWVIGLLVFFAAGTALATPLIKDLSDFTHWLLRGLPLTIAIGVAAALILRHKRRAQRS